MLRQEEGERGADIENQDDIIYGYIADTITDRQLRFGRLLNGGEVDITFKQ